MHMSVFRLVHLPPSVAALLLLLPMATARASVLTWASKDGSSPQGYDYSKTTAENYRNLVLGCGRLKPEPATTVPSQVFSRAASVAGRNHSLDVIA